ncbi:MAG: hypothetical protein P8X79_11735 [Reinekea sp.]
MSPLCFPKIGVNLWCTPVIVEKQIKIKLLHPASTLKSRIQVIRNKRTGNAKDAFCQ